MNGNTLNGNAKNEDVIAITPSTNFKAGTNNEDAKGDADCQIREKPAVGRTDCHNL